MNTIVTTARFPPDDSQRFAETHSLHEFAIDPKPKWAPRSVSWFITRYGFALYTYTMGLCFIHSGTGIVCFLDSDPVFYL